MIADRDHSAGVVHDEHVLRCVAAVALGSVPSVEHSIAFEHAFGAFASIEFVPFPSFVAMIEVPHLDQMAVLVQPHPPLFVGCSHEQQELADCLPLADLAALSAAAAVVAEAVIVAVAGSIVVVRPAVVGKGGVQRMDGFEPCLGQPFAGVQMQLEQ